MCVAALLVSAYFYLYFSYIIRGAKNGPFRVVEVEDKNAEHLVFLATYVIPLLSFGLETPRQVASLIITLGLVGVIYVRTNLFYANPTLSLLGFKICSVKVSGDKSAPSGSAILIARDDIDLGSSVNIIRLDKNIYFAKKAISIKL